MAKTQARRPEGKQEWRPHKGPQEFFLRLYDRCFEALFGGSKGPGKTDALMMDPTRELAKPNFRAIIFRRTYPQLQEVMDRCHKWYPSLGGHYKGDERRWYFPSGAKISLGHCHRESDKWNYQGHEYQRMYFDQLEQFTETQYRFLISQCRTTDPNIVPYVRATANPGGVGHGWVKRRFITGRIPNKIYAETFKLPDGRSIDLTRTFIPATIYDNPTLVENDPRYLAWLMSLPEKERKAFLEGNWDVFEGQFFDMWNLMVHAIQPFRIPPTWKRFISLDYGYSAPSSVGWWAINHDNQMFRYRELYQEQLVYSDLADVILSLCDPGEQFDYVVADPAIWHDRQHHKGQLRGETGYETMSKIFMDHGERTGQHLTLIKADNDRINGWNRMRTRMMVYPGASGRLTSHLLFFNTCRNSIRTIPDLIHDDVHPEDLDTTGEDHTADDTRYGVMSRPTATLRPPPAKTPTEAIWGDIRKETKKYSSPASEEETAEEIYAT